MVQNATFSPRYPGKDAEGLQNCPRAGGQRAFFLQEVEGKGVILTLLSGKSVFLCLKNQFSCLPGGILYIMPWWHNV